MLRREPLMMSVALSLLLLLVPLTVFHAVDARQLGQEALWAKPMRFAFSLAVYLITLAYLTRWMTQEARDSRLVRWTVRIGVAAIIFEQSWITLQAARGLHSHYNYDTLLATVMWALMGVGSILLTLIAPVIGSKIWVAPDPFIPASWRAGSSLGLILAFPLTVTTAGTMAAIGAHHIMLTNEVGASLPIFGWSLQHGDLRVAHFLATHSMQVIPLLAVLAATVVGRSRVWPAVAISVGYTVLVGLAFHQALGGFPFFEIFGPWNLSVRPHLAD